MVQYLFCVDGTSSASTGVMCNSIVASIVATTRVVCGNGGGEATDASCCCFGCSNDEKGPAITVVRKKVEGSGVHAIADATKSMIASILTSSIVILLASCQT